MRPLASICALACALVGCGGPASEPRVWLVDGYDSALGLRGRLEAVPRGRAATPARAVAVLLLGPTAAERQAGVVTAIPPGTLVEAVAVTGGTARVRLVSPRRRASDLGVYGTAQVVYTLTGFARVSRVVLTLDGRACCLYRHDGKPVAEPMTRAHFRGWQGAPSE